MMAKKIVFLGTMLLSAGMAFAAGGYYNLVQKSTTTTSATTAGPLVGPAATASTTTKSLYLYQELTACTLKSKYKDGTCIGSVASTPQELYDLLKKNWVDSKDDQDLNIGSAIDLGEFTAATAAGTCVTNHVALPTRSGAKIYGGSFTISNLCYVMPDSMETPMGLFESADNMNISGLTLQNVRMIASGSNKGADYYPMGAVVGKTYLTTVEKVVVKDVYVEGPVAGGMVGLLQSSSIRNLSIDDDIVVANKAAITTGYAGSKAFSAVSDHNAFVGGLVAVALRDSNNHASFDTVTVTAKVRDLADGHKSAVGGIAGLYSTRGESISNVTAKTKYVAAVTSYPMWGMTATTTPADTIDMEVSGGSSMGGLFGAMVVYSQNNTPIPGDFTIANSSFEGVISNAKVTAATDAGRVLAVGGLIGLDSVVSGMTVTISKSTATLALKDSLQVAGNYYYYAGGLVGYGGVSACGDGSQDPEDHMAFTGSSATGSISLAASGADVKGLHVQTFVGGIAGAACLAQDGNALLNTSSAVGITANVKTSADSHLLSNGNSVYDTLLVGGIAGYMNGSLTTKALPVTKVTYTGSIAVKDSMNSTAVGGIVGAIMTRGGQSQGNGHSVDFTNVKVNTAKVIDYVAGLKTKVGANNVVSKVGGVCGICSEFRSASHVGVKGSISVSGNFAGDSLIVGGLFGNIYSSVVYPEITSTYVNGDIKVAANVGSGTATKVGYLVGSALFNKKYTVTSNYHYGANDLEVAKPFGALYLAGEKADSWKSDEDISYTVRNGESEDLHATLHNGTKLAADMQSADFTKFLNSAFDNEDDYSWTYVVSSNDNMPIVLEDDGAGCPADKFMVNFVDHDLAVYGHQCVAVGGKATALDTVNVPAPEGQHCSGWDADFSKVVTADMTINAKYSANKYKVYFKQSADGKTLFYDDYVAHGSKISESDVTGAAKAVDTVGYVVVGWSSDAYLNVTEDLVIYPVFKPIVSYVTYLDKNEGLIKTDTTQYPDTSVAPVMEVIHDAVGLYDTVFSYWEAVDTDKYVGDVYKAVYDTVRVGYTVKFWNYKGDSLIHSQVFKKGSVLDSAMRVNVARASSDEYDYSFKGWFPALDTLMSDKDVKAEYDSTKRAYTITFMELDNSVIDSKNYFYGDTIEYPEFEKEGYDFNGWSSKAVIVTKNMEIYALVSMVSSSSVEEPESSSSEEMLTVAKAKVSVSGSAVCLAMNVEGAEEGDSAQVIVLDEVGNVFEEYVDLAPKTACVWEKLDMASGKYTWTLNASDSVIAEGAFLVNNEIMVAARGWRMVSIAAMDKSTLNDASFYWWDEENPVGDYWQYKAYAGEDAEETRGFWFGSSAGKVLAPKNTSAEPSEEIVWKLDSLYSGWNMVANPYGWRVDLTSGSTDNGATVKFWKWVPETSSYRNVTVVEPYEAVWAKASASTIFRLSAAPVYNENAGAAPKTPAEMKMAMRKSAARKASASNWTLAVSLADENGKTDSWNVLGAGSEAETMDEPPVGMGERVTLAIRETAKGVKLSKSIKTVADSYEWLLDVSANRARDGKVSFDGVKDLNALGYSLYVTADGVTQELKDGESLPVALKTSAQTVTVRVASAGSMTVASSNLKGFSAIQNAGALQVGFTAPETLAGSRGHYALVSVNGKKVASGNFTATAGSNVLNLNAPKSGLYFMQVKVGSQNMSAKVMVK